MTEAATKLAFIDRVRRMASLSAGARLVAAELACRHNDDEGGARPSRDRLAADLGFSVASVKRFLRELTDADLFVRSSRTGESGGDLPALYSPQWERGSQATPEGVTDEPLGGHERTGEEVTDDPLRGSAVTPEPLHLNPSIEPCSLERARYAFEGSVIRLNQADYDDFKALFSAIPDFDAALRGYDLEFSRAPPKSWFLPLKNKLQYQHQETTRRRQNDFPRNRPSGAEVRDYSGGKRKERRAVILDAFGRGDPDRQPDAGSGGPPQRRLAAGG